MLTTEERYNLMLEQSKHCLTETHFPGKKYRGKVRDCYDLGDEQLIISTDRLSGFDRDLMAIPFKGQLLNRISDWWFQQTTDATPNHFIARPHPNAMRVKSCEVFPIEFVMRRYITGSTNTALWTLYQQGERHLYGHQLPPGLRKNQLLPEPILTPTSKSADHDEPLTANQIVAQKRMPAALWEQAEAYAKTLFTLGSEIATQRGLILVDTKYEFGIDATGQVCLVDELHTPDSSRYWLASTYQSRFEQGLEPDNLDKEMVRLWYAAHCDPYDDATLPTPPIDLIVKTSQVYTVLFEMITGETFDYRQPDLTCLNNYFNQ